jgi:hypothetical protein
VLGDELRSFSIAARVLSSQEVEEHLAVVLQLHEQRSRHVRREGELRRMRFDCGADKPEVWVFLRENCCNSGTGSTRAGTHAWTAMSEHERAFATNACRPAC